jgi:hypothetical protein
VQPRAAARAKDSNHRAGSSGDKVNGAGSSCRSAVVRGPSRCSGTTLRWLLRSCLRVVWPSGRTSCPLASARSTPCRTVSSNSGSTANRVRTRTSASTRSARLWCGVSEHGGSWSQCPHGATVTAAPGAPHQRAGPWPARPRERRWMFARSSDGMSVDVHGVRVVGRASAGPLVSVLRPIEPGSRLHRRIGDQPPVPPTRVMSSGWHNRPIGIVGRDEKSTTHDA